jgi:hypothetical protein
MIVLRHEEAVRSTKVRSLPVSKCVDCPIFIPGGAGWLRVYVSRRSRRRTP